MKAKISIITLIVASFFIVSCNNSNDQEKTAEEKAETSQKKLRHVVLFKFKDGTPADSIAIAEKAFSELPSKIPEIKEFEWGIDNSIEELHDGYTHSFLVTFHSTEDRATYFPHPDHQEFVKLVSPILQDVLVIDYWASE